MYNLLLLINKIELLTDQQKLSINQMLKEAGVATSVIANMKRGQNPSIDKIMAIAEYFNVSVDYLLGRTDNPEVNK